MFAVHFVQSFDIFSNKLRELLTRDRRDNQRGIKTFSFSFFFILFFFFRYNHTLENVTAFKSNHFLYLAYFKEVVSLLLSPQEKQ